MMPIKTYQIIETIVLYFVITKNLEISFQNGREHMTTSLTLSGAHFSVELILAINGKLGVFGVADYDSGIRIAKLKMADPR